MRWLAVLDMDGTLLERRTIDVLCEKLSLLKKLEEIDRKSESLRTNEVRANIAELFVGIEISRLEEVFDLIPIVRGADEFTRFLKSKKFVIAIVTDSYSFLAARLARRLGIDDVKGNELEAINGVATGRITMPLGWEERHETCQETAICKLRAMKDLMKEYSVPEDRTLAVGDSRSDEYMIQKARVGVAFRPKDESIVKIADIVIKTDFHDLLERLKGFSEGIGN